MPDKDYSSKRDFEKTPEPPMRAPGQAGGPLTFVVQKHAARRLHYDFRLELDGVLKSWAVTKGPSANPAEKRLAVMVEDHPIDYAGFEGSIPEGEYGAGQVIVWDRGTYSPDEGGKLSFKNREEAEQRMRDGLENGKLSFTLRGEKMQGSWTLVKMHNQARNWLLIKHRDTFAKTSGNLLGNEKSVDSGLTINDLKAGARPHPASLAQALENLPGIVKAGMPSALLPMLATLSPGPFTDEAWLFEPKLDGYRILAFIDNGRVRLISRRGNDITTHYEDLGKRLQRQSVSQVVLDGELIALDARGKQCFQCLQGYLNVFHKSISRDVETPSAILYYVFDIIYLDGFDLTGIPLDERKRVLKETLVPDDIVRLVEYFPAEGETVYKAAIENGLEGVIAKQRKSRYEPGRRSPSWLKIKAVQSDDFVVLGYTRGKGNRASTFGALLLGYRNDDGTLRYSGNVGSGFDSVSLRELKARLDGLKTETPPLEIETGPVDEVTWTKPELVVEVKYSERTREGRLRAPVFLRLRDEKSSVTPSPIVSVGPERVPESHPQRQTVSGSVQTILRKLEKAGNDLSLEIGGRKLKLSNLDKVLWPETEPQRALTKRDLLHYLAEVSPLVLPHLRDRPLSLNRFPDGIHGEHFFQKHYEPVPEFVETVTLSSHDTPPRDYLLCNNPATLLWLGQIADIELHTWFSRVSPGPEVPDTADENPDDIANYPDFIIFDIDPYIYSGREKPGDEPELNRKAFRKAGEVGLQVRETLDRLGFSSFIKTSGRTGLHIFLPIERRLDFHATHAAAETLSKYLHGRNPRDITDDWAVEKRRGKIFLDYNQNVRGKTLASVYSPRPSPEASVSVPLHWDELKHIYPTDFTILTAPDRFRQTGDIWSGILEARVDVTDLLGGMSG